MEAAGEAVSGAVSISETEETESAVKHSRRERDNRPLEDPSEAIAKAEAFLRDVYQAMDMEVELKSVYDGEILNVQMNGDDMGLLIGKRGQTLDSLQYLANLAANKRVDGVKPPYVKISVDAEGYRAKREATLRQLARRMADRVLKQKKSVMLEPMNPYERRIIHTAIQEIEGVTSHSVGEGDRRRVVVTTEGGDKIHTAQDDQCRDHIHADLSGRVHRKSLDQRGRDKCLYDPVSQLRNGAGLQNRVGTDRKGDPVDDGNDQVPRTERRYRCLDHTGKD